MSSALRIHTRARNFVPAVEFVAYSLENWDERLGGFRFGFARGAQHV